MSVTRHEVSFADTAIAVETKGVVAERIAELCLARLARADIGAPVKATLALTDDSLREDGSEIVSAGDTGLLAEHLQERVAYHFADGCRSGLVVHAGAVAHRDGAWLFPAQSGSGKSTLTAWLTSRGFGHMGDELVHAAAHDAQLQGWIRPIGIKRGGVAVVEALLTKAKSSTTWLDTPLGAFLSPELLSSAPSVPSARASAIVFPAFERGRAQVSMRTLSPAETSARLLQCVLNARHLPAHGLSEVATLCRRVPGYELVYGSFETLEERLQALTLSRT